MHMKRNFKLYETRNLSFKSHERKLNIRSFYSIEIILIDQL